MSPGKGPAPDGKYKGAQRPLNALSFRLPEVCQTPTRTDDVGEIYF
jgi:hypothetical protein